MKLKAYEIIRSAIEAGAAYGVNRAFKYEDRPSRESLSSEVTDAIMHELCGVIDFDDTFDDYLAVSETPMDDQGPLR